MAPGFCTRLDRVPFGASRSSIKLHLTNTSMKTCEWRNKKYSDVEPFFTLLSLMLEYLTVAAALALLVSGLAFVFYTKYADLVAKPKVSKQLLKELKKSSASASASASSGSKAKKGSAAMSDAASSARPIPAPLVIPSASAKKPTPGKAVYKGGDLKLTKRV